MFDGPSFKSNCCQHISSVDSLEPDLLKFFGTVGYDRFFLKGYKHLVVMGLDSRHVILTPPLPSPLQHPKLRLLWISFNALKLSIESVAWTSSFFVTLGL